MATIRLGRYTSEAEDLPETFSDIYVVDPTHRVVGSVDLSRLLAF